MHLYPEVGFGPAGSSGCNRTVSFSDSFEKRASGPDPHSEIVWGGAGGRQGLGLGRAGAGWEALPSYSS